MAFVAIARSIHAALVSIVAIAAIDCGFVGGDQSDPRRGKGGRTLRGGAREIRPQSRAHATHAAVDARAHLRHTAAGAAALMIVVMGALVVGSVGAIIVGTRV